MRRLLFGSRDSTVESLSVKNKIPVFTQLFLTSVIAATVACGATRKAAEPVQPQGMVENIQNPAIQRFVYTSSLSANSGFTIIATPNRILLMMGSQTSEWENTPDDQFVRGMVVRVKEVGDRVFLLTSEGYLYFFTPGKTRPKKVEVFSKPIDELELFAYTGTDGKYDVTLVNGNCVVFVSCPDGKTECVLRRTEGGCTRDESSPFERY